KVERSKTKAGWRKSARASSRPSSSGTRHRVPHEGTKTKAPLRGWAPLPAERLEHFPRELSNLLQHGLPPLGLDLRHPPDQRGADDHTVGHLGQLFCLLRLTDAKPDADRQVAALP